MGSTIPGMRGRTSTSLAGSMVPVATTTRSIRPRSTFAVAGGGAASPVNELLAAFARNAMRP